MNNEILKFNKINRNIENTNILVDFKKQEYKSTHQAIKRDLKHKYSILHKTYIKTEN